jgi:myo-inositol 2-dehydrogenase/D-chiro-inositol 1-dehydrogenase
VSAAVVRVGIVGLGAVARVVYLPLLARRPDRFRITALCDLSPGLLAEHGDRYAVSEQRRHTDLDELIAGGDVDALLVLTSGSHAAAARAAIAANLPVLVEKPLAYTLIDVDALCGSRLVQLGYMKLFDPAVRRAVELLGDRPAPRAVDVTVLHPPMTAQLTHLPPPTSVPPLAGDTSDRLSAELADQRRRALGPAAERFGAIYTDVLLGSIVHDLYVVRALVGDPMVIDSAAAWPPDRLPGSLEFSGTLPGGARLSVRWHYLERYPAYREEVRVHDEAGSVSLDFPAPYLLNAPTRLRVMTARDGSVHTVTERSTREAFDEQLLALHDHVTRGGEPPVGIADGRRDVVTSQRIVRALAERSGIPVGGEAEHA